MELTFIAAGAATVLAGLALEQRFFARGRAARRGEAIAWSIGWFALALLIVAGIAIAGGPVGGLKILLVDVLPIGDIASLAVIALLLAGGIGASMLADRRDPPEPADLDSRTPPRCPPGFVQETRL